MIIIIIVVLLLLAVVGYLAYELFLKPKEQEIITTTNSLNIPTTKQTITIQPTTIQPTTIQTTTIQTTTIQPTTIQTTTIQPTTIQPTTIQPTTITQSSIKTLEQQQTRYAAEIERQKQIALVAERQQQAALAVAAEAARQQKTASAAVLEAERNNKTATANAERQKQEAAAERQRQAELASIAAGAQKLQAAAAAQKLQAEAERQKQVEAERQKQVEIERQKQVEAERQRQVEAERQRQVEAERQRLAAAEAEQQRLIEAERQRLANYLYPFKSHTFTSAGIRGRIGPTLDVLRKAYSDASWTKNNDFFNIVNYNGIQLWTVPETGSYTIRAVGAGIPYNDELTSDGLNKYQKGIDATITTKLIKGEKINILVGQMSSDYSKKDWGFPAMGGAGGTFVVREKNIPIIVAGGGGGRGRFQAVETSNATDRTLGQTVEGPFQEGLYRGGTNGLGGNGSNYGTAGGGLLGKGTDTLAKFPTGTHGGGEALSTGGEGFLSGGNGGYGGSVNHSQQKYYISSDGGFGGGGGALGAAGGGGGGYSGGASAEYSAIKPVLKDGNFNWTSGGGGGSYSITGNFDFAVANNNDNGFVVITANF